MKDLHSQCFNVETLRTAHSRIHMKPGSLTRLYIFTCSAVLEGKETNEIYHKSTDGDEHQPIVIDSRGLKGTLQQT